MSETNVADPLIKRSVGTTFTKAIVLFVFVSVLYGLFFIPAELFVRPWMSEQLYVFFFSQLFISLSGLLYGWTVLLYRAPTMKVGRIQIQLYTKPLLMTTVLFLICTWIGYIFLFIPGLILFLLFFFYPFVVVEEEMKHMNALKRSVQLVKKVWVRLLVYIACFYITFLLVAVLLMLVMPFHIGAIIMSGAFVFVIETFVYYRLFQQARIRENNKKRELG